MRSSQEEKKMNSDCCGVLIFRGICTRCKEHAEPIGNSDDGYDAAKDNYLTDGGYGYNVRSREQDEAWAEECRRNGH